MGSRDLKGRGIADSQGAHVKNLHTFKIQQVPQCECDGICECDMEKRSYHSFPQGNRIKTVDKSHKLKAVIISLSRMPCLISLSYIQTGHLGCKEAHP